MRRCKLHSRQWWWPRPLTVWQRSARRTICWHVARHLNLSSIRLDSVPVNWAARAVIPAGLEAGKRWPTPPQGQLPMGFEAVRWPCFVSVSASHCVCQADWWRWRWPTLHYFRLVKGSQWPQRNASGSRRVARQPQVSPFFPNAAKLAQHPIWQGTSDAVLGASWAQAPREITPAGRGVRPGQLPPSRRCLQSATR
jgi:hypothetical protein